MTHVVCLCMYVCMHVCMYVSMYVCMYVCMCVCVVAVLEVIHVAQPQAAMFADGLDTLMKSLDFNGDGSISYA
jgi:hypothetical protein